MSEQHKRQSVTVELDEESIAAARAAGIDLSELLVQALRRKLPHLHAEERAAAAAKWQEENRAAIDSINRLSERHSRKSWPFRQ